MNRPLNDTDFCANASVKSMIASVSWKQKSCNSAFELEDIKQDCWLIALQIYKNISTKFTLRKFIKILKNQLILRIEKQYKNITQVPTLDNNHLIQDNPINLLIIDEQRSIVDDFLERLFPVEKEVIRMRYRFDKESTSDNKRSLKEIGIMFNISRDRIRQIEGTAMKKLARYKKEFDCDFACYDSNVYVYNPDNNEDNYVAYEPHYHAVKTGNIDFADNSQRQNSNYSAQHITSYMLHVVAQQQKDAEFEARRQQILDSKYKPHYYDLRHPSLEIIWISSEDEEYSLMRESADNHPNLSAYLKNFKCSLISGKVIIDYTEIVYIVSTPYIVFGKRFHMPYIGFTYQDDGVYVNKRMWGEIEFKLRKKVEERLQLVEVLDYGLR